MPVAPVTQMVFPLADSPRDSGELTEMLAEAFEHRGQTSGLLELAEEALRAHPTDALILRMAATAALFDERPDRALIYLKRYSKRYVPNDTNHLLHALALAQQHKLGAAHAILERHGLASRVRAMRALPDDWSQSERLWQQFDRILAGKASTVRKRAIGGLSGPPPTAAVRARPAERPRGVPPPSPPAREPAAPPGLPLIDIDIPFVTEFDLAPLMASANNQPEADGGWYQLRERFAHLGLAQGFDELLCLPHLHGIETFRHQIETARKVLKQFRGRVLLADEVGLGKTIEAGMVLKEYLLRGMVESVLVLVPPSLVGQWRKGAGDQVRRVLRHHARRAGAQRPRSVLERKAPDRLAGVGAQERALRTIA